MNLGARLLKKVIPLSPLSQKQRARLIVNETIAIITVNETIAIIHNDHLSLSLLFRLSESQFAHLSNRADNTDHDYFIGL